MVNRREFLGTAIGAGAALAFTPNPLRALQEPAGKLIQRAIPSTGEMLPVISFGPRPFDGPQPTAGAPLEQVLEAYRDNGGKVVDVLHGSPKGEQAARAAADALGIQDKFFWTTSLSVEPAYKGPILPGVIRKADPAAVRAGLEEKLARFKAPKIDLVMVGSREDVSTYLAVLREMKKEGRVRYIGVWSFAIPPYPPDVSFARLESIMRNEPIDFVATEYAVHWRGAEERILPLAMERKIGFMAYFAFDRGRVLQRVGATPLPEWAAEFDAKTWAQFCLKYVVSHPAVTVVRTGTTKAAHMLDNIGGGIGRLPNEAMRKRMAEFVDSLPQVPEPLAAPLPKGVTTLEQAREAQARQTPSLALSSAILDRYVGEYKHVAVGTTVTVRRDGDKLLVKVNSTFPDESPFVARSETCFASGPILTLEFQLDGQGTVTGAVWGPNTVPLVRM
jgi:aryl-alcohol dehydrogenase-like predicted oxidoreductase